MATNGLFFCYSGRMAQPRRRRVFFDWQFVRTERRRSYRMALLLFWSVLLYLVFSRYLIGVGIVADISMFPTLWDGQYFLINKYAYRISPPRRGDIVVLRIIPFEEEWYVKRVVGLPGESLALRDGQLFINGQRLVEPYAAGPTTPAQRQWLIPPDHYFVLGDNRRASYDSRHFGPVRRNRLAGKIRPGKWFPW